MATALKRLVQQHTGTQTFQRVELIADGAAVVDGTLMDLRGATGGASLYNRNVDEPSKDKYVLLNRAPNGDWSCIVATTHTGAASSNDSTISTYPHAVIGASGQTVARNHAGNITESVGLQRAFTNAHDQFLAWGRGLDALAVYEPATVVAAGHDWLRWAHICAYLIANSNTYSFAQKIAWAETVIEGAADVSTPTEFYANSAAHTAPTTAKTWVNPANGNKVNLANSVTISGSVPTLAQLANGEWIKSL